MLPSALALCLAAFQPGFSLALGLLGMLGVMLGHLGLNLMDDYFDYRKEKTDYRETMAHEGFRARIGKCHYLTDGSTTLKQLGLVALGFCTAALLIGVLLIIMRGTVLLWIALAAVVLGFSYSGVPLRLSYHGLGELTICIIFGPLNMLGVYFAACSTYTPLILFVSIPVGLLVAGIVYVHSILDFEPDKKINKRTMAVLLDNRTAMLAVLSFVLFAPFLIIALAIGFQVLSLHYLAVFLTLPLATALFYLMLAYVRDPNRAFARRLWMGPMARWEQLKKGGIDWFMLRWYLARNLLSAFCFIAILTTFAVQL
jgi:1,4-dihydroxy-2-naphthoate octaprenyltransferase